MITPDKLFTLGMVIEKAKGYPDLKFWDGINSHETYNKNKSYKHRQGMPNEIRIEFDNDDRGKNWNAVMQTCCNLWEAGYSFAVFFVEGGRSPHIHLYDINELDNLTFYKRTWYRKLFLEKFCPPNENPDYGLCDEKHLCALEFANHFKYDKPKALLNYFWQGGNHGCDYNMRVKATKESKEVETIFQQKMALFSQAFITNQPFKLQVENALTFEKVFDRYGVKYRGTMACCPFHNDTDYSLAFNNEKKLFHCFSPGCNIDGKPTKGKILTLIKLLEKKK